MKRHEKLQDLSREHYSALKLALLAKRAAQSGAPEQIEMAAASCVAAFASDLEPHFCVEESTWLPALVKSGAIDLVSRTEHDHAELRSLASRLQTPDATTLQAFAERLTAHVRFEERELFEAIETLLK